MPLFASWFSTKDPVIDGPTRIASRCTSSPTRIASQCTVGSAGSSCGPGGANLTDINSSRDGSKQFQTNFMGRSANTTNQSTLVNSNSNQCASPPSESYDECQSVPDEECEIYQAPDLKHPTKDPSDFGLDSENTTSITVTNTGSSGSRRGSNVNSKEYGPGPGSLRSSKRPSFNKITKISRFPAPLNIGASPVLTPVTVTVSSNLPTPTDNLINSRMTSDSLSFPKSQSVTDWHFGNDRESLAELTHGGTGVVRERSIRARIEALAKLHKKSSDAKLALTDSRTRSRSRPAFDLAAVPESGNTYSGGAGSGLVPLSAVIRSQSQSLSKGSANSNSTQGLVHCQPQPQRAKFDDKPPKLKNPNSKPKANYASSPDLDSSVQHSDVPDEGLSLDLNSDVPDELDPESPVKKPTTATFAPKKKPSGIASVLPPSGFLSCAGLVPLQSASLLQSARPNLVPITWAPQFNLGVRPSNRCLSLSRGGSYLQGRDEQFLNGALN